MIVEPTIWVLIGPQGAPVERRVAAATWKLGCSGVLPDALTPAGAAAWDNSAEITWWRPGVDSSIPSPWRGQWWPQDGTEVRIIVKARDAVGRMVFAGVIDSTSSSSDGTVTSRCVDFRDRLRRTIRAEAVLNRMPSSRDDYYQNTRVIPTPLYPVTLAARAGGFSPTFIPKGTALVDVPLTGAVAAAPGGGFVVSSQRRSAPGNANLGPLYIATAWGIGIRDGQIAALPNATVTMSTLRVALTVDQTQHTGDALIDVNGSISGGAERPIARVAVTGAGQVVVSSSDGTTYTPVVSAALAAMPNTPAAVEVTIRGGQATITTSDGSSTSAAMTLPSFTPTGVGLVAETGAAVAGLWVGVPGSTPTSAAYWYPRSLLRYGGGAVVTDASPSIRDQNGLDLIAEIANATLCSVRFDAIGVLQWMSYDEIWTKAPALTVTTATEVLSLAWETDAQANVSTVEVEYASWAMSDSTRASLKALTLGGSMTSGETRQEWVTIPDDEEWIYLATTLGKVTTTQPGSRYGSWVAATKQVSDADAIATGVTASVETVTPWAHKVTVTASEAIDLRGADVPGVDATLRKVDAPILRARGLAKRVSDTYSVGGGPEWAPVYRHELGRWGNYNTATLLAAWLMTRAQAVQPRLTDVTLILDERIEPWTVLTLKSPALHGVELDVIATTVQGDPAAGTTRIDCIVRAVRVVAPGARYSDLAAAWQGGNYTALAAAWAGKTYDNQAADPTRGAPA